MRGEDRDRPGQGSLRADAQGGDRGPAAFWDFWEGEAPEGGVRRGHVNSGLTERREIIIPWPAGAPHLVPVHQVMLSGPSRGCRMKDPRLCSPNEGETFSHAGKSYYLPL